MKENVCVIIKKQENIRYKYC